MQAIPAYHTPRNAGSFLSGAKHRKRQIESKYFLDVSSGKQFHPPACATCQIERSVRSRGEQRRQRSLFKRKKRGRIAIVDRRPPCISFLERQARRRGGSCR